MHSVAKTVSSDLKKLANPAKAKILQGFFKTGEGQYGEGDVFYGVTVPQTRTVAAKHAKAATLADAGELLHSKIHEERLAALLILVHQFQREGDSDKKRIYEFYLKNAGRVNNWDLVDLSAPKIVGAYLQGKDKAVLRRLARSKNIWERRIAIVATFHFIYYGDAKDALEIAEILLHDKHDLIQKAVGWMLREVGKRCSQEELEGFLRTHGKEMPRTMLRYAIERLPEAKRKQYLQL
jgi:3-methyladenine DNA glycosylase AlkD